jgi:hypothetical protein
MGRSSLGFHQEILVLPCARITGRLVLALPFVDELPGWAISLDLCTLQLVARTVPPTLQIPAPPEILRSRSVWTLDPADEEGRRRIQSAGSSDPAGDSCRGQPVRIAAARVARNREFPPVEGVQCSIWMDR